MRKIDEELSRVSAEIKVQSLRAVNILVAIVIVIAIAFMLKFIAKNTLRIVKDIILLRRLLILLI